MSGGLSMSKTKIVVLQLKEIVYTAIFVALGILLILLLVFMFVGKKDDSVAEVTQEESVQYTAGVYNTAIQLGDNVLNLEVVIDENHINSVRLLNIDEAISTMYPLIEPSLSKIEEQLVSGVSLEELEYADDSKYTQMLLVDAIQATLDKAAPFEEVAE